MAMNPTDTMKPRSHFVFTPERMRIPGGVEHSNQVTANAELCFLFIEPSAVTMPTTCCTLKISPLCRELILTLANRTTTQRAEPMTRRLIQVLFDELPQQPQQQLHLPVSSHPKIRTMVDSKRDGVEFSPVASAVTADYGASGISERRYCTESCSYAGV